MHKSGDDDAAGALDDDAAGALDDNAAGALSLLIFGGLTEGAASLEADEAGEDCPKCLSMRTL